VGVSVSKCLKLDVFKEWRRYSSSNFVVLPSGSGASVLLKPEASERDILSGYIEALNRCRL
jgi:hypothetical protein